jgi:hemerythrin
LPSSSSFFIELLLFSSLSSRLRENFIQLENRLVSLMRKWLLDHILNEDLKVKKAMDIHESENAGLVKSR